MHLLHSRLYLLGLMLASTSIPALAQSQPHCPATGTVLTLSTGVQLTFAESHGIECSYTSSRHPNTYQFMAGIERHGISGTIDRTFEGMFPLKVGASENVLFDGAGAGNSYFHYYDVLAVEDVTVKAGTFHTYKIQVREESTTSRFSDSTTYWYSDELGYPVKMVYETIKGIPSNRPSWEVTKIGKSQ